MVSLLDKTSDLCYIFHDFQSNSDERSVLHAFLFPQKVHSTAAGRLHTGTNPNRIQPFHRRNHHLFLRCRRKDITICGTGKNTSRHCRFLCTIRAHTACPLVRKRLPLFIPCDSLFLFRCFCMFRIYFCNVPLDRAFRLALIKPSKSPSITPLTSEVWKLVRWSFTRRSSNT